MHSLAEDTIGGFNAFLGKQKELEGEAVLTLTLFNNSSNLVHDGVPLEEIPELDNTTYNTSGSTSLFDALGQSIDSVGERLSKTPEEERPGKVIVMVMTDGEENSSKKYTLDDVKERVEHQQDVYKWEFVFLGANIDSFSEGSKVGMTIGSTSNYVASSEGTREAWGKLNRSATRYRSDGIKGDVDEDLSSDDELDY